jgi:bacillithiol biosynthesis cysteine-adding enzyme BshC
MNPSGDLIIDCLSRFERVAPFYARDPSFAALSAAPPDTTQRPLTADDVEELIRFNTLPFSDESDVRRRVERIAQPETTVIMTGQQTGLLLGPLFTVSKALNAIRLARRLEEKTGRPAEAVFWIASEDHDFDEVSSVSWLGPDDQRRSALLPLPEGTAGHSVGTIPLDKAALARVTTEIAGTTGAMPSSSDVLALIEEATATTTTLGEHFRHLLLRLLQPLGLIVVDPWFSAVKRHLSETLRSEIENPGATTSLVLETSERLRAAGLPVQVHRREGDVNFFFHVDGVRGKARWTGTAFEITHPITGDALAKHGRDELTKLLSDSPEVFSPNVVTKPLVRDRVFRPLAYVAGPGELAYHAQLKALYENAGVPMPAIVPRAHIAILNPRPRRALRRLNLSAQEWLAMSQAERDAALARSSVRADALRDFEESREKLLDQMKSLENAVVAVDPGHRRSVERLLGSVSKTLDKLGEQMTKSTQQRDSQIAADAALLDASLEPGGNPQERVDNVFVPHMMLQGQRLIERLFEIMELDRPDLQVIEIA